MLQPLRSTHPPCGAHRPPHPVVVGVGGAGIASHLRAVRSECICIRVHKYIYIYIFNMGIECCGFWCCGCCNCLERIWEKKVGNWETSREDTPMLRPDFAQQERCGNTFTWNVSWKNSLGSESICSVFAFHTYSIAQHTKAQHTNGDDDVQQSQLQYKPYKCFHTQMFPKGCYYLPSDKKADMFLYLQCHWSSRRCSS